MTIVCEAVLQERLIKLLITLGVSGYTIIPAQGAGSHGKRMGDMAGYNTNIEVKTNDKNVPDELEDILETSIFELEEEEEEEELDLGAG